MESAVLVTTPDRFSDRTIVVAEQVGVSHRVQKRLVQRMQNADIDVSKFNVRDFVRHIDVSHALTVHGQRGSSDPELTI